MIFKPEMIDKILAGQKTVTRRPVKTRPSIHDEAGEPLPCKYKVGRTYALQPVIEDGPGKGRGGKSVGRIRILSVLTIPLCHQLTELEAAREGFGGFRAFRDYWEGELYGTYDPTQLVHRIEFELIAGTEQGESR